MLMAACGIRFVLIYSQRWIDIFAAEKLPSGSAQSTAINHP